MGVTVADARRPREAGLRYPEWSKALSRLPEGPAEYSFLTPETGVRLLYVKASAGAAPAGGAMGGRAHIRP